MDVDVCVDVEVTCRLISPLQCLFRESSRKLWLFAGVFTGQVSRKSVRITTCSKLQDFGKPEKQTSPEHSGVETTKKFLKSVPTRLWCVLGLARVCLSPSKPSVLQTLIRKSWRRSQNSKTVFSPLTLPKIIPKATRS